VLNICLIFPWLVLGLFFRISVILKILIERVKDCLRILLNCFFQISVLLLLEHTRGCYTVEMCVLIRPLCVLLRTLRNYIWRIPHHQRQNKETTARRTLVILDRGNSACLLYESWSAFCICLFFQMTSLPLKTLVVVYIYTHTNRSFHIYHYPVAYHLWKLT